MPKYRELPAVDPPVQFLAGPKASERGFAFRLRSGPDGKPHATRATPIELDDPGEIEVARAYCKTGHLVEVIPSAE